MFGLSATAVAGLGSAALGAYSATKGSKQSGEQTTTQQNKLDPRVEGMLFGEGGNQGLLNTYQNYLNTPQSEAMKNYGTAANDYLGANGTNNMNAIQTAATGLLSGNSAAPLMSAASANMPKGIEAAKSNYIAPEYLKEVVKAEPIAQAQAAGTSAPDAIKATLADAPVSLQANLGMTPQTMQAAQVSAPQNMVASLSNAAKINAPSQNKLDLSGAYNNMINGDPAKNPYLTGAIAKGINQSNNAFQNMQTSATDNLLKNILPAIRGGAVASGQYGGSRQGIAEGNAMGDFAKAQQQAMSQFGQNNTDAAVAAQAGAFDNGQNRSLSAMSGLNSNQYATATQNAGFEQQTGLANQSAQNQAAQTNYQGSLQAAMQNAANLQQANQTNYQGGLQQNLANQSAQNNAAQTSYQGGLQTNLANANAQNNAAQTSYQGGLQANLSNANNQNSVNLANFQGNLQSNLTNTAAQNNANNLMYNGGLQQSLANTNAANQASQTNFQGGLTGALANAGYQQSANQNNQQAQISTNGLNSNNQQAGASMLGGLLNNAYTTATNQDSYDLNKASKVNGLLSPYLGANSSSSTNTPLYENKAGNILGGATAGLGIANGLSKSGLFGASSNSPSFDSFAHSEYNNYVPFGL